MCHFIIIGANISIHELEECAGNAFSVTEIHNPFFKEHMSNAETIATLTDGHCSCSICASTPDLIRKEETVLRKRYRRKGFSEKKIDRIVCDMIANGRMIGANSIQLFFEELHIKSDFIYVYCHMYSGNIETEIVPLNKKKTESAHCFERSIDEWLPEDTIVYIPK
jgi:hypothetical protein